ncbi:MAG TPA: 3-hydroxyacyl-CoA dehydrogenase NAD-binding domain-containing protein, partial [Thermoanaerobaculia bacterium]
MRTLGVVGAGTMGQGIAQVAAQSGYDVVLVDVAAPALEHGRAQIAKGPERLVATGKLAPAERDAAGARVAAYGELAPLAAADLVVEAVVERLPVKQSVLTELDR